MRRSMIVVLGIAALGIVLSGCSGGGGGGGNQGVLSFIAAGFTVNEDGTLGTAITIQRVGGSAAVAVTVVLTDGSATAPADYSGASINVAWAAGDLADKIIAVPIVDDNDDETDETLTMTLTNPTNGAVLGAPASATLTILDDPNDVAGTVEFTFATYTYNESSSSVGPAVVVTRSGGIDGAVTVLVTSSDGTANSDPNSIVEPVDYSPVIFLVSFADQDATPVAIPLSMVQDLLPEMLLETFTLSMSNPTNGILLGAIPSATVSILDNDTMLQLDNPGSPINGFFGSSVAKIGQRLAIGAPGNASGQGEAFSWNVDNATVNQSFDGGPFSQEFGSSLSSGGNTLGIGGMGSGWSFGGDLFLNSYGERFTVTNADDGFGWPVFVRGGSLHVGAPLAQIGGSTNPSGRTYTYDAVTSIASPTLDGVANNKFGSAFGAFGSELLVGSPGNDGQVQKFGGSPLTLNWVIANPFPESPSNAFGAAVATIGGAIVVGAPDANTFAVDDGRIHIFDGGPPATILAPGPITPSGRFGAQILVTSTNRICVQQPGGDGGVGRVWVLDSAGVSVGFFDCPVPSANANFGASMCEFDGALVIGAPGTPFLVQSGSVFIFRLP